MRTILTESQIRDLALVAQGYARGESAATCESLCRRGLLRGDWITGYDVTARGRTLILQAYEADAANPAIRHAGPESATCPACRHEERR